LHNMEGGVKEKCYTQFWWMIKGIGKSWSMRKMNSPFKVFFIIYSNHPSSWSRNLSSTQHIDMLCWNAFNVKHNWWSSIMKPSTFLIFVVEESYFFLVGCDKANLFFFFLG
jgi:hypothetical protein